MRVLAILSVVGAGLSVILGFISKLMLQPLKILPGGLEAFKFLMLANTLLLAAAVFLLFELINIKKK